MKRGGQARETEGIAAWVGIDWGSQSHQVTLQVSGRSRKQQYKLEARPEAVHAWLGELEQRFEGRPVAVCVEKSRGSLLWALMGCSFVMIYAVNPQSAAKYRAMFKVSGAKDDPLDSDSLLDLLVRHGDHLEVFRPQDVTTRKLQLLCQDRRKLVDQRDRIRQQLGALLENYYPQARSWAENLTKPWAWKFLKRWPSLQKLQRARPQTLRQWYEKQKRRPRHWQAHLQKMANARAVTDDAAVMLAAQLKLKALLGQLKALSKAIDLYDKEIQQEWAVHPDRRLFESFPGAGAALAPRLSAALGTRREVFEEAADIQKLSGVAPVLRQSGKSFFVLRRYACDRFLLQTFHEFAGCSIPHCKWAKAYYEQQRDRGCDHHAAVRALAYKWQRILFRCWKDRKPYEDLTYCEALKRRGSPLCKRLDSLSTAA